MKILVFGNSHVGSLGRAYKSVYKGNNRYSFIARPQGRKALHGIEFDFSKGLILHDDKEDFTVWCNDNLTSFDAFAFVGYKQPLQPKSTYSTDLLNAWKEDILEKDICLNLSNQLAKVYGKISFIISPPFRGDYKANIDIYEDDYKLYESHIDWLGKLVKNEKVVFVKNPEETTLPGKTKTRSEFVSKDGGHMNEDYGLLLLKLLDRLVFEDSKSI